VWNGIGGGGVGGVCCFVVDFFLSSCQAKGLVVKSVTVSETFAGASISDVLFTTNVGTGCIRYRAPALL
jgi:hypothetical protein